MERTEQINPQPSPAAVLTAMADHLDTEPTRSSYEVDLINVHVDALAKIAPNDRGTLAKESWDSFQPKRGATWGQQAAILRDTAKGLR